jgi:hypothetical protein
MGLKKLQEEYRATPRSEVVEAVIENFLYGLLGAILVVFIAEKIDIAVLVAYMVYYFYVGKVVNRPKYVTSLGKFIVFPVPAALGAFTGYKLAQYLSTII